MIAMTPRANARSPRVARLAMMDRGVAPKSVMPPVDAVFAAAELVSLIF